VPPGPARTVPWRAQADPSWGKRRYVPAKGLQTARDLGGCTGEALEEEDVEVDGRARGEVVVEEVSTQR